MGMRTGRPARARRASSPRFAAYGCADVAAPEIAREALLPQAGLGEKAAPPQAQAQGSSEPPGSPRAARRHERTRDRGPGVVRVMAAQTRWPSAGIRRARGRSAVRSRPAIALRSPAQRAADLAGDLEVLPCGEDERAHGGAIRRDLGVGP